MKQKILIALWLLLPLSIVAQPMRPMAARNITMADGLCSYTCPLYTSDAADDLLCVDLGGRRTIKYILKNTKLIKIEAK